MDDTDDFYFDRVSQIQMDHWSKGRVALLGDAAACVSLLAGEGTGLAFVEAYVLAGELRRANGDYKEAFRQYEQQLQEFLKEQAKSARKMVSFFAPDNGFEMWLMRTVVSALFIPFLSKFLLGRCCVTCFIAEVFSSSLSVEFLS
ncbi:MAG: FAD-dependent monooxygenase [Thermodesulfobacteriota bacterium]